ncbi:CRISPR-associated protein Cas4 [Haloarcula salina]|uniref:CRISPR-associated protein Cas4 n=1 Tax=Haloarcula salina TaxID=1429914 RepID=UPI003C7001A7
MSTHTFRDLETAAYCPRKLYYRRRDGASEIPDEIGAVRRLATEYERLLTDDAALLAAPIEVGPDEYRGRLRALRDRLTDWDALVAPADTNAYLEGRDARGIAHKLVAGADGTVPALSFAGRPPENGVWEPQTVRLVAAAKALSWEREREVSHAYAEYPAYGVVRRIDVNARRTGVYRRAVRTADSIDGPPGRVRNDAKCEPCEFRENCGVRTRSLRSMLR